MRAQTAAMIAPAICAAIKPGASTGRIPEKLFVNARAKVIAGFAKLVEAVNQYPAVMTAATIAGSQSGL